MTAQLWTLLDMNTLPIRVRLNALLAHHMRERAFHGG